MEHWNTFWGLFAIVMGCGLPIIILAALSVFIRAMIDDLSKE